VSGRSENSPQARSGGLILNSGDLRVTLPRWDVARPPLVGQADTVVGQVRAEKAPGDASQGASSFPTVSRNPRPTLPAAGIGVKRTLRSCLQSRSAEMRLWSGRDIGRFDTAWRRPSKK
jgi:hypothetical protein